MNETTTLKSGDKVYHNWLQCLRDGTVTGEPYEMVGTLWVKVFWPGDFGPQAHEVAVLSTYLKPQGATDMNETPTQKTPTRRNYHFRLGDSTDGPVGFCATVQGTDKEDALGELKLRLYCLGNASEVVSTLGVYHVSYIAVHFNPDKITVDDVYDVTDIEDVTDVEEGMRETGVLTCNGDDYYIVNGAGGHYLVELPYESMRDGAKVFFDPSPNGQVSADSWEYVN